LPIERADLEQTFAELAAGRRAGYPDDHIRHEAEEDANAVVGEEVARVQEGHQAHAEDDRHERGERPPLDLVSADGEHEEPSEDAPMRTTPTWLMSIGFPRRRDAIRSRWDKGTDRVR